MAKKRTRRNSSCAGVSALHRVTGGNSPGVAVSRWDKAAISAQVRAVRVLWADGRAQQLGPAELSYLHPVVARRRP